MRRSPGETDAGRIARLLGDHPSGQEIRQLFALTGEPAAELDAIINSMPDAVYIGGADGIKKANRAALDQLGYDTVEELNRHIATLAEEIRTRHASTGERIRPEDEPFARAMMGESVIEEVIVRHRKTGEDIVVRCAASPVVFEGRVIGAVAINSDITASVRLQQELETANRSLRRANEALEAFNDVVMHDLKEPVRAMGIHLETAQDHARAREVRESLSSAMGAHARLTRQMGSLIEFSRVSVEPLVREPILVADVLRGETCRLYYERLLAEREGTLVSEVGSTVVLATPFLLGQILGNLILNGIRHNDRPRPTVRVRARRLEDASVEVVVEDDGPGFAEHVRRRFGPAAPERPRTTQGGFGLSIASHAVGRLQGTIRLGSSSLGGASVTLTLPPPVTVADPAP